MKKKIYDVLSMIPFVNVITDIICKPVMFCSPGMAEGIYDDLFAYMKNHPDILITEKLAKAIREGKVK